MNKNLQDLYRKLDGVGGDTRIAFYGQMRAAGFRHRQAMYLTLYYLQGWCRTYWPLRQIPLPGKEEKKLA